MGLIGKLTKSGIAAKVVAEARKPQNQAKAKQLFAKLSKRRGSGRSAQPAR